MKKIFGLALLLLSLMNGNYVSAVDVNNFVITRYDVQMTLGRDSENRSVLRTIETISAQFPEYDQNHGIERSLVDRYDTHSTQLKIESVTDEKGTPIPYAMANTTLRIGDANTYAHGSKTYKIIYTQHDVTRYYNDTDRDEFYWDIIGTEWAVPIQDVSISLKLDGVKEALRSDPRCYTGVQGTGVTCAAAIRQNVIEVTGIRLRPYEGLTLALGFAKGTFASYTPSLGDIIMGIWAMSQIATTSIALGLALWIFTRFNRQTNRNKELGTIVPEYLPPAEASVTTSARVGGYITSNGLTAQMLDLAVRHYIKIYEVSPKTLLKPAEYEIEVIKEISDLRWEEQEILTDTFAMKPTIGQRLNLKSLKTDTGYYRRALNNNTDLDKKIKGEYGFREKDEALKKWCRRTALILLLFGLCTLSVALLFISLVVFILSTVSWRLTDKGLVLRRYLKGLEMYIKVAEEDRIRMLQSPDGAEKVPELTNGTDSVQLIKLYERVLPYAVLFGQEKKWNQQLGQYYETTMSQPDWFVGNSNVFNAAVFSTAMNSFGTTATVSSGSSSTGGSGGGGFSGGGGGGGGGGGW